MLTKKSSYLSNEMRKCNVIFRKNVSYDNIERHKKPWLYPISSK